MTSHLFSEIQGLVNGHTHLQNQQCFRFLLIRFPIGVASLCDLIDSQFKKLQSFLDYRNEKSQISRLSWTSQGCTTDNQDKSALKFDKYCSGNNHHCHQLAFTLLTMTGKILSSTTVQFGAALHQIIARILWSFVLKFG